MANKMSKEQKKAAIAAEMEKRAKKETPPAEPGNGKSKDAVATVEKTQETKPVEAGGLAGMVDGFLNQVSGKGKKAEKATPEPEISAKVETPETKTTKSDNFSFGQVQEIVNLAISKAIEPFVAQIAVFRSEIDNLNSRLDSEDVRRAKVFETKMRQEARKFVSEEAEKEFTPILRQIKETLENTGKRDEKMKIAFVQVQEALPIIEDLNSLPDLVEYAEIGAMAAQIHADRKAMEKARDQILAALGKKPAPAPAVETEEFEEESSEEDFS